MKIEKINDNQIKCTLTKEDLESRQIKLNELAYGNDKARALFKEMMEKASYEFGFEAEDVPLMIEAVPISSGAIVLLISKVEYPEELDTRFSQFTQDAHQDDSSYENLTAKSPASANEIIDLFNKAKSAIDSKDSKNSHEAEIAPIMDITKLFVFESLDDIIRLSYVLKDFYHGENVLYKNPKDNRFYLLINKSDHSPEEFNKVCNILGEYGIQNDLSVGQSSYYDEHYRLIVAHRALETLAEL